MIKKTVSQCTSSDYCKGWNDAIDEMQKWIDVNERLPEEDVRVLVAITDENYKHVKKYVPKLDTDRRFDGRWVRWGEHITHWMPLPEPPKGEEK